MAGRLPCVRVHAQLTTSNLHLGKQHCPPLSANSLLAGHGDERLAKLPEVSTHEHRFKKP